MPTQNSSSGDTEREAAPPPTSSSTPSDAPPSPGGDSPTPVSPAPQTFSGTWFQEGDPQILLQWTVSPAPASGSAGPSVDSPSYIAEVRIYQQIFDTQFPNPPFQGPVVPFSVSNPALGPAPYLQGSFVLTQTPSLEVVNLRFPGFQTSNLILFPSASTDPGTGSATPGTAEEASSGA